jgi:DNA glycosylase AlkZ-like
MGRHRLLARAQPSELVAVAGAICGLHAQVMSSAELSLWARIDGLEQGALDDALWNRRELVKVWAMRGTLHLLPADELGLWVAGFGTYTSRGMTGRWAFPELTEAVARALEGRLLTRDELALEVEQATGNPEFGDYVRGNWGSFLKPASWRGRLCFAPGDGGRVRFTSPVTWLPGGVEEVDPTTALAELTRRVLAAYAPITAEQLGTWSGFGRGRAKRLLADLGDEAVELDLDGERVWALARDAPELVAAEVPGTVRLLPAFDPWVVGAHRRAPVLDPSHTHRVYRPQGWMSPVVLVNGRTAGVWRHARKGRRLVVEVEPFERLPAPAREQLEAEAERLARLLGGELQLAYDPA